MIAPRVAGRHARPIDGAAALARAAALHAPGPVRTVGPARAALALAALFLAGCGANPSAPDDFGGPGDAPEVAPGAAAAQPAAPDGAIDAAPRADAPPAGPTANGGSAPPAPAGAGADRPVAPPVGAPVGPPGVPVQLTDGGCCVRPLWRADSRALWFIDRPADGPTGIYEARLDAPLAAPALVTTTVGSYSPDQRWRIELASGRTTLRRLADDAAFEVPAGGRSVSFSPDGRRIAWQGSNPNASLERQVARIMIAAPDGSNVTEVVQLPRGSLVDWLGPDALLVRARETADSDVEVLWRQPLGGGDRVEILRAQRLRNLLLSPDKAWLAYSVSGAAEPGANGLWLAPIDGASPPRRLDRWFGAYRWRDGHRLVLVPFDVGAPSHRFVEVDAATAVERPLTDPAAQSLRIAGGDWAVSPDGRHVAFVSAADRNLWVLALAD